MAASAMEFEGIHHNNLTHVSLHYDRRAVSAPATRATISMHHTGEIRRSGRDGVAIAEFDDDDGHTTPSGSKKKRNYTKMPDTYIYQVGDMVIETQSPIATITPTRRRPASSVGERQRAQGTGQGNASGESICERSLKRPSTSTGARSSSSSAGTGNSTGVQQQRITMESPPSRHSQTQRQRPTTSGGEMSKGTGTGALPARAARSRSPTTPGGPRMESLQTQPVHFKQQKHRLFVSWDGDEASKENVRMMILCLRRRGYIIYEHAGTGLATADSIKIHAPHSCSGFAPQRVRSPSPTTGTATATDITGTGTGTGADTGLSDPDRSMFSCSSLPRQSRDSSRESIIDVRTFGEKLHHAEVEYRDKQKTDRKLSDKINSSPLTPTNDKSDSVSPAYSPDNSVTLSLAFSKPLTLDEALQNKHDHRPTLLPQLEHDSNFQLGSKANIKNLAPGLAPNIKTKNKTKNKTRVGGESARPISAEIKKMSASTEGGGALPALGIAGDSEGRENLDGDAVGEAREGGLLEAARSKVGKDIHQILKACTGFVCCVTRKFTTNLNCKKITLFCREMEVQQRLHGTKKQNCMAPEMLYCMIHGDFTTESHPYHCRGGWLGYLLKGGGWSPAWSKSRIHGAAETVYNTLYLVRNVVRLNPLHILYIDSRGRHGVNPVLIK